MKNKKMECMEKRKVIDCFMFFNELDILEKRLVYMDPYVDKFIIVESPTTHSGDEKPFYFEQNSDRFSKWKDKIIYIKTNPLGDGFWDREKNKNRIPGEITTGENWKRWEREGQQRFAIEEELYKFSDDDIIIYSDLDEIPDMTKVDLNNIGDEIYVCKQRLFRYSFDYMVETTGFDWYGTIICSNKKVKEINLNKLRLDKQQWNPIIDCGWSMTKFGSEENAMYIYKAIAESHDFDFENDMKNKIDHQTRTPLIKTSQEIKDSVPKIFIGNM